MRWFPGDGCEDPFGSVTGRCESADPGLAPEFSWVPHTPAEFASTADRSTPPMMVMVVVMMVMVVMVIVVGTIGPIFRHVVRPIIGVGRRRAVIEIEISIDRKDFGARRIIRSQQCDGIRDGVQQIGIG